MKISATEAGHVETAIVFIDELGELGGWLLLGAGEVMLRGEAGEPLPAPDEAVLVVPGNQVAIHWLELAGGLPQAQAAAAARLMLADSSAETLTQMHVVVGRSEGGLTPVAIVTVRQMTQWLAASAEAGLDPHLIVPAPMLLQPPSEGIACREVGAVSDYRGQTEAFSLEPELAEIVLGGRSVEMVDNERFEADLPGCLDHPPINLRQGAFTRRRAWRMESERGRRLAWLVLALVLLTLAIQVTMILRYTFAADALEEEARVAAADESSGAAMDFSIVAPILFDSVLATPNVELTRIDYRSEDRMIATIQADSPATLAAVESRIEGRGFTVETGAPRNAGGRSTADFTVRP